MGMNFRDPPAPLAPMDAMVISGHDAAQYVERMCVELSVLADRAGLGFLAYLLEVAREEAMLHADVQTRSVPYHGDYPPQA